MGVNMSWQNQRSTDMSKGFWYLLGLVQLIVSMTTVATCNRIESAVEKITSLEVRISVMEETQKQHIEQFKEHKSDFERSVPRGGGKKKDGKEEGRFMSQPEGEPVGKAAFWWLVLPLAGFVAWAHDKMKKRCEL